MTKTYDELYQLALSKMAIPTCECLLDGPDKSRRIINNKDYPNDSNRTSRTRAILAQAQNKIP